MRITKIGCKDNEVSKCYWKNGASSFVQCRVAANLQFEFKRAVSAKHNKAKQKKMKYAYVTVNTD